MATVELKDVTKRFGDSTVVEGANLDIADGEFVVLVGPSGCGKSTTLRMIAGLEGISDGEIRIAGQRVNETPPGKRNLAMVFQSYALYPHMSVAENMGFSLRCRGESPDARRPQVLAAAEILGLTDLLDRRPSQLSGGQRQRVALGRAMVRQPQCFLFDEPLSNLDAALRSHMRVELRQLRQRMGTTSIYVTHDQIEAMTLGDRIVVMDSGKIVQIGAPLEVYEWPNSRFVGAFLGAPPMNFVSSRRVPSGQPAVRIGQASVAVPPAWERVVSQAGDDSFLVGIRPEHMTLEIAGACPSEPRHDSQSELMRTAPGRVVLTEQHGGELLADVDLDGEVVKVARLAASSRIEAGQDVRVSFPADAIRLFTKSGQALRP